MAENDLISRKALIVRLAHHHAHSYGNVESAYGLAVEEVQNAPSVEAEPVRHGRWVSVSLVDRKGRVLMEQYKCSECGRLEDNKQPYCHCGARMDAKEDA